MKNILERGVVVTIEEFVVLVVVRCVLCVVLLVVYLFNLSYNDEEI